MSQCWSRYISPYGVTRPQGVKHKKSDQYKVLHVMKGMLSWHVPNFITIWLTKTEKSKTLFPLDLNSEWKIFSKTSLWACFFGNHSSLKVNCKLKVNSFFNRLRPHQNGWYQMTFSNACSCFLGFFLLYVLIKNSLKFVPKGSDAKMSSLVPVMAWLQTGDKPLPEPMMT